MTDAMLTRSVRKTIRRMLLVGCGLCACALLATAGCDDKKVAPAAKPGADVPAAETLPTVDLCGPGKNTRTLLETQVKEGGLDGVRRYFSEHVKVPANVTLCDAVTGQSNTHVRVVRVLVQQVDARGHGAEPVISVGTLPQNPRGLKSASQNAFPAGNGQGGVGIVVDFYGP